MYEYSLFIVAKKKSRKNMKKKNSPQQNNNKRNSLNDFTLCVQCVLHTHGFSVTEPMTWSMYAINFCCAKRKQFSIYIFALNIGCVEFVVVFAACCVLFCFCFVCVTVCNCTRLPAIKCVANIASNIITQFDWLIVCIICCDDLDRFKWCDFRYR